MMKKLPVENMRLHMIKQSLRSARGAKAPSPTEPFLRNKKAACVATNTS